MLLSFRYWIHELLQNCMKQTTIEYTLSCSLHGMQYIFEKGKHLFASRVIWIVIVLIAIIAGIILSIDVSWKVSCTKIRFIIIVYSYYVPPHFQTKAYDEWVDSPVLTSLHTTAKPISEIEFPSITICGQGSVKEVIMSSSPIRNHICSSEICR